MSLKWFGAVTPVTEAFGRPAGGRQRLPRGHGRAISTWISSESETFGDAAKQQAERVDK